MTTATRVDLKRVARLFHALSDPTRLRLMLALRCSECCVCDLVDATEAGQSRVSFHLKVLKDAGLITDRRDGRWVHYSLNPEAVSEIEATLAAFEPVPGPRQPCC